MNKQNGEVNSRKQESFYSKTLHGDSGHNGIFFALVVSQILKLGFQ